MSDASSTGAGIPPIGSITILRIVCLILALAALLAAFGPPRRIAQGFRWRLARGAPVLFHRLLCAGLGVRVRRYGALSGAPIQLIVANHISWLDIPVLGSLGAMSFLAKKEIGDHLVARELAALQGIVYVDRGRRLRLPSVNDAMAKTMREGTPVVLFAEATTGDGNRLMRFRSSHFEAVLEAARGPQPNEAIVQPIYLDYSRFAGLPLERCDRPRVAWYGDMSFLPHFLVFARGGGVICDVYCGAPILVWPGLDRKTAARQTEAAVRELAAMARASPPIFLEREKS